MRVLRSRASSSLLYSSIPSKSFSFLWTVTWRLISGLDLWAAAAAWAAAGDMKALTWVTWHKWTTWSTCCRSHQYLPTPELSSCRSWAVSLVSSHSSPASPPAPWGPMSMIKKKKRNHQYDLKLYWSLCCVGTESLTKLSLVSRVISCWTLYSTLASGDREAV